ncbi:hypothetical protein D038_4538B, partial [Vibrio parahaemolyticus IDH02189]
IRLDSE